MNLPPTPMLGIPIPLYLALIMDSSVMEIVKLLWKPVTQQIYYIKDLHRNIEDLESKMDELTSRESDLKNEVDRARLELQRVLSRVVDTWLKETEAIKQRIWGKHEMPEGMLQQLLCTAPSS
ncbi:hypothetical protein ACLOJK_021357 [Asimina triloba]